MQKEKEMEGKKQRPQFGNRDRRRTESLHKKKKRGKILDHVGMGVEKKGRWGRERMS